jgi:hypothetical protein
MNPRSGAMRSAVLIVALGAVMVAGCSRTGSTAVQATPVGPATWAPMTSAQASPSAPIATPVAESVSAPTVTVTVTPSAPAPTTVVVTANVSTGPFQSPSGNIRCAMFAYDGQNSVRCDIDDYSWTAPPRSPNCQLSWGSRFKLEQGGAAVFDCYAQELPAVEQTLGYGEARTVGTITCGSEPSGMTCADSSTGHYFRVSRETYEVG